LPLVAAFDVDNKPAIWREPALLSATELEITDWPLLSAVLQARGITTREAAKAFLNAADTPLADPHLLPDMQHAVELIRNAVTSPAPIAIFGDYDVDGLTSTSMLYRALTRLGATVIPHIPDRRKDGYGLNTTAIDRFAATGVDVMIVVDCGSGNSRELEYAISRGLRPVVLDHHLLHGDLPTEIPFVSPRRQDNRYPTDDLAAVGVAFTLIRALIGEDQAEMYLPYVALGTVADVVELRGENRTLVARGLEMLRRWSLPGLKALCDCAEIDRRSLNTWHIGFVLGPRLNAAGRMDSPDIALQLLLANDYETALPYAAKLEELNRRRQAETRRITQEAERMVEHQGGASMLPALVVDDPSWSIGLAGIVAGRLAETYYRPAIVIERGPLAAKGSARSAGTVDIVQALDMTASLLENYGGHAAAAGLSLPSARVEEFRDALSANVLDLWGGVMPRREIVLDAEVQHSDLRLDTVERLSVIEPNGQGNPAPLFLVRGLEVRSPRRSRDGKHLMWQAVGTDARSHGVIFFSAGDRLNELSSAGKVDVACDLQHDDWNGNSRLKLHVRDFRLATG
jgi:single-stranded-DNA-specific exonuclease